MSILEAILLGIVQGLTEFLPISSSGHLILVPWLQDYDFLVEHPRFHKTFDVALHAGSLVAAISYFRHQVLDLARGFLSAVRERSIAARDQRLSVAIALATLPAFIAGGLGEALIADELGEPWMIALQLIFFGLLLGLADRAPERLDMAQVTLRRGIYIGLAQVLALAPGTSRSGITITAARFLGFDRDTAARFSFLLLIPVVTGATIYSAYQALSEGMPGGVALPMVAGMIAAAVSGYIAIAWLLRLLRTASYRPFVIYRLIAGAVVLLIIATGLRGATF